MKLIELREAVVKHRGEFICEHIGEKQQTKLVHFIHVVSPPIEKLDLPSVGRLNDFYETFGSILFYHDVISEDAGKYIAHPHQWDELHGYFSGWVDDLLEDERKELVPDWADTCLVIGETPASGNYVLMPIQGPESGHVFEFDHDGFEFNCAGKDIVEYVEKLLKPDGAALTEIASHMRFIEKDSLVQWWMKELRDNTGRIVKTKT